MVEGVSVRVAAAVIFGLRSMLGVSWGFRLIPDTDAYLGLVGGVPWFYPSPGGRLVGAFGYNNLAAFSVVCSAALGYFVVVLAQRYGGSGWLAVAFLMLSPLGWYLQPVALDSAGALFVVLCCLYGRSIGGDACYLASLLLHPASGLGYLCWRAWRGGLAAVLTVAVVALCGVGAALMTPYSGVFSAHGLDSLRAVTLTFALAFALPAVFFAARVLRVRWAPATALALWSAASVVVVLVAQGGVQMRYLLPTFALLSTVVYVPSREAV